MDTFNLVVCDKPQPETRKGILSSIATIYDPLGLAGPLLLPGREINQELRRRKYGWNDKLPDELVVKWRNWKSGLGSLTGYSIPRSLTPGGSGEIERTELHHFADTSEEHGYGTVSYPRFINREKNREECSKSGLS